MVLPETDNNGALRVAERLRVKIAEMDIKLPQKMARVTASFGVATTLPSANITPAALLSSADVALYAAKGRGRNQVCSADPPQPRDSADTVVGAGSKPLLPKAA